MTAILLAKGRYRRSAYAIFGGNIGDFCLGLSFQDHEQRRKSLPIVSTGAMVGAFS